MLKLRLNNTAASWLTVAGDVRVLVPPCTTATLRAAEHAAFRALASAKEAMGVEDGEKPTDEQLSELEGVFAQARIRSMATRFEQWEGLAGEDGQPLPISPEALDAFASHPALGRPFLAAYETSAIEVVQEGNGSETSGSGKPPEASNTADPAPGAA
jgi:hypothetical protein